MSVWKMLFQRNFTWNIYVNEISRLLLHLWTRTCPEFRLSIIVLSPNNVMPYDNNIRYISDLSPGNSPSIFDPSLSIRENNLIIWFMIELWCQYYLEVKNKYNVRNNLFFKFWNKTLSSISSLEGYWHVLVWGMATIKGWTRLLLCKHMDPFMKQYSV